MTRPLARRGGHGSGTRRSCRCAPSSWSCGWLGRGRGGPDRPADGPAPSAGARYRGYASRSKWTGRSSRSTAGSASSRSSRWRPAASRRCPTCPIASAASRWPPKPRRAARGGALVLRRHYESRAGGRRRLTVPPFVIAVRDRQGGDDAVQEIRTDPVPITVTSVVPDGADYTEPKDIAPPMSLPSPAGRSGSGLCLGGRRRRRRRGPVVAGSAPTGGGGAAAAGAPARARRTRSPAAGRAWRRRTLRGFYVRLSAILRRYLGWRFGCAR